MKLNEFNAQDSKREIEQVYKSAKKVIEKQQQMIDALKCVNPVSLPTTKSVKSGGSFLRAVIADVHGVFCDRSALSAFLSDMEAIKPKELFILGDFMTCDGFLAQHHVMGFVSQTKYTWEDDIHACNTFLDRFCAIFEKVLYLTGNHESRIMRQLISWSIQSGASMNFVLKSLIKTFAVENVLELEKRGIEFLMPEEKPENVQQYGVYRGGKSLYMHTGFERGAGGIMAAPKHLQKFGTNVCAAHTHINLSYTQTEGDRGETISYRNPGCLCEKQPLWKHSEPSGWTNGYILEIVKPDGAFLSLNVPIINGVSLFPILAEKISK